METTNSYFTDENSTKYNANNINIFKTTSINKSKFVEYFGTDGYIDIKDNNGVVIQRIDNNTEVDENLISKDLTIETLNLDMMENSQKMVSNVATIKGESIDVITNTLEYKIKERTEATNPDKPTNQEQPDNPDTPNKPSDSKYSISGQAWLDSNGNGQKDSIEHGINDITVSLMEEQTGNIVKEQITQNDGNYEFANIEKGNYIVIFK